MHVWQFLSRLHVVHDHVGQIGAGVLGLSQVGCDLVDVDLHLLDELAGRVLLPAKKVEHVAPVVVAGDGLCQLVRLVCSSGGAYHEALLGRHEAFCVVLAGCGQGLPGMRLWRHCRFSRGGIAGGTRDRRTGRAR